MSLDWNALGQVTAVSIGVTFAVVVVFALGVLGLAQAGLCFLACVAVVAYGIYLIVPQFH